MDNRSCVSVRLDRDTALGRGVIAVPDADCADARTCTMCGHVCAVRDNRAGKSAGRVKLQLFLAFLNYPLLHGAHSRKVKYLNRLTFATPVEITISPLHIQYLIYL